MKTQKELEIVRHSITEYIAEHHQEQISLEEIAEMEQITKYHVSHFIRKMLGISFQEYLNNIRFDHALRLLSQTDLNLLDICMESGFSSSRYLNQIKRRFRIAGPGACTNKRSR